MNDPLNAEKLSRVIGSDHFWTFFDRTEPFTTKKINLVLTYKIENHNGLYCTVLESVIIRQLHF